jgi:hypothetical protein
MKLRWRAMFEHDFSITKEQAYELAMLAGTLHKKGEQYAAARDWTAAIMFVGSSAEAALLATLCVFEPELRKKNLWCLPKGDPTKWTLGGLLNAAKQAAWLPTGPASTQGDLFSSLSGDIGDATKFLSAIRIMATHPGAYIREELRPDFEDEEHMLPTFEILNGIYALVLDRLTEQLNTLNTCDQ